MRTQDICSQRQCCLISYSAKNGQLSFKIYLIDVNSGRGKVCFAYRWLLLKCINHQYSRILQSEGMFVGFYNQASVIWVSILSLLANAGIWSHENEHSIWLYHYIPDWVHADCKPVKFVWHSAHINTAMLTLPIDSVNLPHSIHMTASKHLDCLHAHAEAAARLHECLPWGQCRYIRFPLQRRLEQFLRLLPKVNHPVVALLTPETGPAPVTGAPLVGPIC